MSPSGDTKEALQPPKDTIAPIGWPVRSANAWGSPRKPIVLSRSANCGICCGIHMPSSARAAAGRRARQTAKETVNFRTKRGRVFKGSSSKSLGCPAPLRDARANIELCSEITVFGALALVKYLESQKSRPSSGSKTPIPSGPLARPAAPGLLGGGNTTLEDLARRGRSDLDPSLAAIPSPAHGTFGSGPDWSLDTDALKPNSVNGREEDEAYEPPPSSPGTLISEVQRGVKPATDRDSGRIRPPERPADPSAAATVVKESAGDPLSQLTERIHTIPSPAGSAPKEPIREAPPAVTVVSSPPARTLPPPQTPGSVVPLPAGGAP